METSEINPWRVIKQQTVYDNSWIEVIHHDVVNTSDNVGVYGVVHFKHYALGVIVLDDDLNTWLVGQYRFPLKTYTWEIPEGGGKREVAPLISAKRELLEETGIVANNWKLIQELQLSNSATDEVAFIYLARELNFGIPNPDDGEQLQIKKVKFAEAYNMVCDGVITDSLSVAAILKVKLLLMEQAL
jgi:ADP-ribose pyrophosphatase